MIFEWGRDRILSTQNLVVVSYYFKLIESSDILLNLGKK